VRAGLGANNADRRCGCTGAQGITSTTEATSLSHDTLYRHIAQDKSELRKGPFALIRGMKVGRKPPSSRLRPPREEFVRLTLVQMVSSKGRRESLDD
jgi:hypothetical protein